MNNQTLIKNLRVLFANYNGETPRQFEEEDPSLWWLDGQMMRTLCHHLDIETDRADAIFTQLDKNADGKVSVDELLEGFNCLQTNEDDEEEDTKSNSTLIFDQSIALNDWHKIETSKMDDSITSSSNVSMLNDAKEFSTVEPIDLCHPPFTVQSQMPKDDGSRNDLSPSIISNLLGVIQSLQDENRKLFEEWIELEASLGYQNKTLIESSSQTDAVDLVGQTKPQSMLPEITWTEAGRHDSLKCPSCHKAEKKQIEVESETKFIRASLEELRSQLARLKARQQAFVEEHASAQQAMQSILAEQSSSDTLHVIGQANEKPGSNLISIRQKTESITCSLANLNCLASTDTTNYDHHKCAFSRQKPAKREPNALVNLPRNLDEVLKKTFKVIFIGDSTVGKTCFIEHAIEGRTCETSQGATVGIDFKIKTLDVDGQSYRMQLWDTAGQERYRSITQNYYRRADGLCVVYDVSNEQSYLSVRRWINSIDETLLKAKPILLIGNKVDLLGNEEDRILQDKLGTHLARCNKAVRFMLTSARDGHNVIDALRTILVAMIDDHQANHPRETGTPLSLTNNAHETSKTCCSA